jgi:methionine aminopeptidase
VNDYTCKCAAGYTGKDCETSKIKIGKMIWNHWATESLTQRVSDIEPWGHSAIEPFIEAFRQSYWKERLSHFSSETLAIQPLMGR